MQLRQYLAERDTDIATFAETIGVRAQTVYRYLTGDRLPRPEVMQRICQVTRGKVQPNDWFKAREAAE